MFLTSSEKKENQAKLSPKLNLTGSVYPSVEIELPPSTTRPILPVITYTVNLLSLVHLQNTNNMSPVLYFLYSVLGKKNMCYYISSRGGVSTAK